MDPWATARPYFVPANKPSWVVHDDDIARLQAYALYENIYQNVQGTFKLMQRGSEAMPIYMPSPKKLIEAINRFLAVDWNYFIDPDVGTPDDQLVVNQLLGKLFKRELMYSKFSTQKRYGLVRGDCVWHIIGDDTKIPGSKISIKEIDPGNYFPIVDPLDNTHVIGCHLTDIIIDPTDVNKTKQLARRQTYLKDPVSGVITSSLGYYETQAWDDRWLKPEAIKLVQIVKPPFQLPVEITTIPVYHIRNSMIPGMLFGASQLSGFERVMGGVNQAITDQDLALSLQGLGLYVTTSGPPQAADGSEGKWELGPGQVVEVSGVDDKFERVQGVSTVTPSLDHIKFLLSEAQSSGGVPDIAVGNVDVTVAESGISLSLKMSPLLAMNAEKEQEMLGRYDQMLYDIVQSWFVAYEGVSKGIVVEVATVVGNPMPINKDAEVADIITLVGAGLMSVTEGRAKLINLGYELETGPEGTNTLIDEQTRMANAKNSDPFMNRFNSELDEIAKNPQVTSQTGQTPNNAPTTTPPIAPVGPPVGG